MKVDYENIVEVLQRILLEHGFSDEKAKLCAELFAKASLDGVNSHGVNRFPFFLKTIKRGWVKVDAEPVKVSTFGALEQWDGKLGPGNLNAHFCMDTAISLARKHGIGCVAIRNTNHWIRAGNYGLQAAEAGQIGICFTNAKPNMVVWGGKEAKTGNNPLVIAIPNQQHPLLLDMSVSLYSYGKLWEYANRNEALPFDGGLDSQGTITKDPLKIIQSELALPAGLWKGSGLSIMLDLLVSLLAQGRTSSELGDEEYGNCQVFIAIDLKRLVPADEQEMTIQRVVDYVKSSEPMEGQNEVRYPGERTIATRERQIREGVEVDPRIWNEILDKIEK
ncbi:3-dehydro-L-gulonate 2-dehydrogenase [Fulvivirgaceae bacterium BMA12]|uniref:3-dehydro-L-gulonate 2-dehydrogenase n=1 Tax=Agaribacillus aureus TaxID=3051825 RepID=A0ABT8L1Z2_9BACT|nr:3-dehydro-L-gulonate 2-dehydrogenase [Fulvivirgaceae bacterium BMA12]